MKQKQRKSRHRKKTEDEKWPGRDKTDINRKMDARARIYMFK